MNSHQKQLLNNNLYAFYRYSMSGKYHNLQQAGFIKQLAKKLEDLIYDPHAKNRLMCAMPPQHSKSSLITLAFPVWLFCKNPKLNILIVSSEQDLASNFGIKIRELIYRLGERLWGVKVSNVKSSNSFIMVEKDGMLCDGSIQLTGSRGHITGRPIDLIVVDDPYKGLEDEFTPSALTKKWNWFTTIIEQRLRKHTKLAILHTRWHSEDIQGKILADEYQAAKYEKIEYAAIDDQGKPLWPEYYDKEFYLDKQRTMGERQFQAIYQQKPLDLTSNFFHTDRLIFEDTFDDHPIAKVRSWDIASSDDSLGDQRDYTAGVRMLKTPNDEYWIFDYIHGQFGNEVKHIIKDTAKMDGPSYKILLEPGTTGGASKLLYNEYKSALIGYNTKQSEPKGTKADRATPFANLVYDGKIHVCINNNEKRELFLSQLQSFPNGKHDDIVDACAYGILELQQYGGNNIRTANKRKRKRIR